MGETEKLSPISIKYTEIYYLWTLFDAKNIFFDRTFWMHNDVKTVIKAFSTTYLSLAVLFPSIPSYWQHEYWVHKTRIFFHDTAKSVSTSNHCFSTTNGPLIIMFNLIKFYTSGLKVLYSLISPGKGNLIQKYVIFAAPIFFETRYFR